MSDIVHVSYSELDAFWACPLRWRWQYGERWNIDESRPALDRGTVWHAMLQSYYELGRQGVAVEDREDLIRKCMLSGALDVEENELLWWMYEGYVTLYGADLGHEVLATEITRTVPLPDPDDPSRPGPYHLKVKIDQVTRDRKSGQLWLWDHKTGGEFTTVARMEWRPQFPLYTWAIRAAKLDVWGFIVNAARTKRNKGPMTFDQRYRRNYLLYNDRQLTEFAVNAARSAAAMHDPDRIEYYAARDLQFGACTSFCDFEKVHRQTLRGIPERQALLDLGFREGYERQELVVTKPV